MLGLALELNPRTRPNRYYTIGGARKAILGLHRLGSLRPNFQLLYKRKNYQQLTIFDQIRS